MCAVAALRALSTGYEDELAIRAAMAASLPDAGADRSTGVLYLLAWQEEPAIDDRSWTALDTLLRAEAHWPAAPLYSPKR